MDVAGAKQIIDRQLANYNVRYVQYLGGSDSKAYKEICEEKPYGEDCVIDKLECVRHVQKGMGSCLKKLKAQSDKRRLADGKTLSGKNRLTPAAILTI